MTEQDLQQLRREKWRLDGKPIRTIEEARAFIEAVGFCLMYPMRPTMPVPTFIGAFVGSDNRLPTWQHAYSDPRALAATDLMVRLLRERTAYEANLVEENNAFLVAASAFPFFYALVGERNPKLAPKQGPRSPYSPLACDAFELIRRDGPISKQKLQEALGGSVSIPALDKALGELLSKLRITRVDYKESEGSFWDVLYRWAPEAVREGVGLSVQQALSALLSKYMDCVIAAEQSELETFFGNFVARSRVKEAVNALLAARELSMVHISGRSMLQITPEKEAAVAKVVQPPRPFPRPRPAAHSTGHSSAPPNARPSGRPSGPNSVRPRTFARPRPKSGGPR
jgi:23S rRNA pseudouridine2605 synthase